MKFFLKILIVFLYIYPIQFVFLPISTRVLYGLFGFIWLSLLISQQKIELKISKDLFIILIMLVMIGLISAVSLSINMTTDIEFIKYVISMTTILFASFFTIYSLTKLNIRFDFLEISNLIINVILIQSLISLCMFLFQEFGDFMISIQRIPPEVTDLMLTLSEFRILGFGGMYFFGAGIINGFALIIIGQLIRTYNFSTITIILLTFKFIFILVIGMMMARTTIIGGFLAICLILIPRKFDFFVSSHIIKKILLFFMNLIFLPVSLIFSLFYLNPGMVNSMLPVFNFAFEVFINYFKTGNATSESTNRLQEMYIFPDKIHTWLIGDGLWSGYDGYYMHTDVGYIRLIYYFGILGLSVFLIMQYYAIRKTFVGNQAQRFFCLIIFIYLLILNLKGFADLLSFTFLYWISYQTKRRNIKFDKE